MIELICVRIGVGKLVEYVVGSQWESTPPLKKNFILRNEFTPIVASVSSKHATAA